MLQKTEESRGSKGKKRNKHIIKGKKNQSTKDGRAYNEPVYLYLNSSDPVRYILCIGKAGC